MSDEEYIRKAESVPYMFWNDITALIESAPEHLKERLRWIMREKEILEQIKSSTQWKRKQYTWSQASS